jgi:hypothetical protein
MKRTIKQSDITKAGRILAKSAEVILTPEQQMEKANAAALFHFNYLKEEAQKADAKVRERISEPGCVMSHELSWCMEDLLHSEIRRSVANIFDELVSSENTNKRTPLEAACVIYCKLQTVLLEQSSFMGLETFSCSTSPAANAMAHYRASAIGRVVRWDFSFIRHYATEMNLLSLISTMR